MNKKLFVFMCLVCSYIFFSWIRLFSYFDFSFPLNHEYTSRIVRPSDGFDSSLFEEANGYFEKANRLREEGGLGNFIQAGGLYNETIRLYTQLMETQPEVEPNLIKAKENLEEVCNQIVKFLDSDQPLITRSIALSGLAGIIQGMNDPNLQNQFTDKIFSLTSDADSNIASQAIKELGLISLDLLDEGKQTEVIVWLEELMLNVSGSEINWKRTSAIKSLKEAILNSKDFSLRDRLSRSIGKLINKKEDFLVRKVALESLGEIIPDLKDLHLRLDLAKRVSFALFDESTHNNAIGVFQKIGLIGLPSLLEKVYLQRGYPNEKIRKSLVDSATIFVKLNEFKFPDFTLEQKLAWLSPQVKTAVLLNIFKGIYEDLTQNGDYRADLERLLTLWSSNGHPLKGDFGRIKEFINKKTSEIIDEEKYCKNLIKNQAMVYPKGIEYYSQEGKAFEVVLSIFGISTEKGNFFGSSDELGYQLPRLNSAQNLSKLVKTLKDMNIIPKGSDFYLKVEGKMMDDAKYIALVIQSLIGQTEYTQQGWHGFSFLTHGFGEENITNFLNLKVQEGLAKQIWFTQLLSTAMQDGLEIYNEFIGELKQEFGTFWLTRQKIINHIVDKYGKESPITSFLVNAYDKLQTYDEAERRFKTIVLPERIDLGWVLDNVRFFTIIPDSDVMSQYGERYEVFLRNVLPYLEILEAAKYYFGVGFYSAVEELMEEYIEKAEDKLYLGGVAVP